MAISSGARNGRWGRCSREMCPRPPTATRASRLTPLPRRSVRLGRHVFAADKAEASLNFSEISSCKAKAPWYSSGAGNFTQPDADLQVVIDAYQRSDWTLLDRAWEGHDMLIQLPGKEQWLLALFHWPDSAVLAWPVTLQPVPGHASERFVEFQSGLKQPKLVTVADIETVKAMEMVWRSPLCAPGGNSAQELNRHQCSKSMARRERLAGGRLASLSTSAARPGQLAESLPSCRRARARSARTLAR